MTTYQQKPSEYLNPQVDKILNNVTRYVSKPLGLDKIYTEEQLKRREVEYASSLPLQIILYFNVWYSIFWSIGTCFLWPVLVYESTDESRVWIILILFSFIMMVIFEIVRLYLGYVGNLSERVPELTGFWLLTLMIEVPLSTFLTVIVWIPISNGEGSLVIAQFMPMQFALQIVHTVLSYSEVFFGFFALRVLARYQISRFHYKQFDNIPSEHGGIQNDDFYSSEAKNFSDPWLYQGEKNGNIGMQTLNKNYSKNE